MNAGNNNRKSKSKGHGSLDDLLWLHKSSGPSAEEHVESLAPDALDSKKFAQLFEKNYSRLDLNRQGITKDHLSKLIMRPDNFTQDEYSMLIMLAKYFDTIANMCDDEPGPQSNITVMDKEVLLQFLFHGNLSLAELHRWRMLSLEPKLKLDGADLPPLSGGTQ